MRRHFFMATFLIILSACTSGASLKVSNMWARPGKLDGNTAAYFTIVNNTKQEDRLVSAESAVAEKCEIHMTKIDVDNKMMMMPQEFVLIPVGSKVELAPGGFHVMLLNLNADLASGENIKMTLQFEKAGKIELEIPIKE